jgi:hypothetical protein
MATFSGPTAPTSGERGTLADQAQPGDLYTTEDGKLFVCTASTPSTGLTGPGSGTSTYGDRPHTYSVTWVQAGGA